MRNLDKIGDLLSMWRKRGVGEEDIVYPVVVGLFSAIFGCKYTVVIHPVLKINDSCQIFDFHKNHDSC